MLIYLNLKYIIPSAMAFSDERKKKYQHFNTPGHAHALNFSCYKNQPLLRYKFTKEILVNAINRARQLHDFAVIAWVFMPNHVHLLIFPRKEKYSVSDIFKSIKQSSANRAIPVIKEKNVKLSRRITTGLEKPEYRFWQDGGGYDRNLWSKEAIYSEIDYIHNNPIRKGFVEDVMDWKWSSAREWMTGEKGQIPLDLEILKGI